MNGYQECFEVVEEPRVKGRCDHPLESVLFLVVAAVIAGADGLADIEAFGKENQDWLDQFVDLPAGIPSHDTIGRLLALMKPSEFQQALLQWIHSLREGQSDGGPIVVPIDGKTCRGSYTDAEKSNAIQLGSDDHELYGPVFRLSRASIYAQRHEMDKASADFRKGQQLRRKTE